jgi:hypothetical protein
MFSVHNHEEFMRTAVHAILMKNPSSSKQSSPTLTKNNEEELNTAHTGDPDEKGPFNQSLTSINKEEYLLFVVKKLQTVGLLQSRVNCILGPLLLIDVAQLVILTCVLVFLPLRYSHKFEGLEVAVTFLVNKYLQQLAILQK